MLYLEGFQNLLIFNWQESIKIIFKCQVKNIESFFRNLLLLMLQCLYKLKYIFQQVKIKKEVKSYENLNSSALLIIYCIGISKF